MTVVLPKKACTGCGACFQSCAKGAITMEKGMDGFPYPQIDHEKCVGCQRCVKVCPAVDIEFSEPMECYAAQILDKTVLKKSTSGGAFYALAKAVFEEKGVVYGCVFNDSYEVTVERADTIDQVEAMHGSKYVWSNSKDSYPLVKKDIENGRIVLYTGLPCQIAGLRKYLQKDYSNLYLVDVLCGGAPSPYAFQRYLETIVDEDGKKGLSFQFRDKELNGSGVNCTYTVNNIKHHENYLENSFYYAFSSKSRLTWRESCYSCEYKSIRRVSDLTIGDYWGVEKHHDSFDPKEGVSAVLVNTQQGISLFDQAKELLRYEKSNILFVTERNSLVKEINSAIIKIPEHREAFFQTLHKKGWKVADKKYLNKRKKILLKEAIKGKARSIWRRLDAFFE